MTVTFTHDSETITVQSIQVAPTMTNAGFPLTCGHRHVTGDTVWHGLDSNGDRVLACDRCVKQKEVDS